MNELVVPSENPPETELETNEVVEAIDASGAQIVYGDDQTAVPPGNQGTGYYRLLDSHDSEYYRAKGYVKGNLVYVYAGMDALHSFIGDSEFVYPYDDPKKSELFTENYQFVPNGAELRQQQIATLMDEINNIDFTLGGAKNALGSFNPHVGASGVIEGSSSLVPAATGMAQMKMAVAQTRNHVLKAQKSLEAKTSKLKQLAGEQARALAIKVKEIQALAAKAEEAIWTINLYLGKEEEIIQLVTGQPAPPEQKIVIRQCALFMDEESGIYAEQGGIDANSVGKFDDWLIAHPDNLKQIVPEDKGIVALHIRSKFKKYEDPWTSQSLNDANLKWTYFLIRNGENVYRVYIDMNVGKHLFPSASEFENYFWTYEGDERVPLKPGSDKWNKAMDAAEDRQKHHMRVLLVLQGLMDRTPIFKPMPTDRINLCDPSHCEEWLHLIYESENVLTDGKPDFEEWIDGVNQQLEVGCRIMGVFDYRAELRPDRDGYREGRIYPANANYPSSEILHTIEEREGERYIFRYARTGEKVYDRYSYRSHEPQVRARCWVKKDDDFYLNFDAASLEKMEYYRNHKLSRQYYERLVPILDMAIDLKREEIAKEAPFRQLLVGQIMTRYGVPMEDAEPKVDELVKWWKFKNRTHRALDSDDQKALTMIVDEYGLRRKQEQVRLGAAQIKDLVLNVVGAQNPAPVAIFHKKDNHYVAYVPHNDQNIWVTEQLWTHNRQTGDLRLKEEKKWKTVDKRHERWETLYQSPRWESWKIHPPMPDILTDPEIDHVVELFLDKKGAYEQNRKSLKEDNEDENAGYLRFLPLAVMVDEEFEITLWYSGREAIIPTKLIISSRHDGPEINRIKVKWKRTAKGIELDSYLGTASNMSCSLEPGKRPWERDYKNDRVPDRVLKVWKDNVELVYAEQQAYQDHKKKVAELEYRFDHVDGLVHKQMHGQAIREARAKFDADFGDPELWEDHLEGLKIQTPHLPGLERALNILVERNVNPEGMTLQQVYEEAAKHGLLATEEEKANYWSRNNKPHSIPANLPDFVIPAAQFKTPKQEQEDDDD